MTVATQRNQSAVIRLRGKLTEERNRKTVITGAIAWTACPLSGQGLRVFERAERKHGGEEQHDQHDGSEGQASKRARVAARLRGI